MAKELTNRSFSTESQSVTETNLKTLYIAYLKKISPDWDTKRINLEVKRVFVEYDLVTSEQNRRDFQQRITEKLRKIERFPNDWFFRDDNELS